MGEDELFKRLKNSEITAQKIWLHEYEREIAQFAFQYGLTTTDASEVVVRTFQQLFKQLPTIESEQDLQSEMYKIAIRLVAKYERSTIDEFTFPEDQLLHNELIQLPHLEKVAFIFTTFTSLKTEEIAHVLNLSVDEVYEKKSEALLKITGHQIEKRLELLAKSYKRMRFQIHEEAVFQLENIEEMVFESASFKSSKRNLYILLTGIVVLIGLIFYSVFNSEAFQQTRFEKSIEKKKETYEQRRTEVLNELGLTEQEIERFGNSIFFERPYLSEQEKQRFDRFIMGIEKDIEREKEIDRTALEEEYTQFIEELQTPSELAASLLNQPLTDDLEASEKFLEDYIQKYTIINTFYSEYLSNQSEIQREMFNGEDEYVSLATVINGMDELPENVGTMIDKMAEQNMYFIDFSKEADDNRENFFKELKEALHPDVGGYITMLATTNIGEFFWVTEDKPVDFDYVKEIEETLLKTDLSYETKQLLEYRYMGAILQLIGRGMDDVYDANGFVQEEYREKWQQFINEDDSSITSVILGKVFQEFEETDWRISETQIYLDENRIWDLLNFTGRDGLDSFDWVNVENTDFQSISLPNRGYQYLLDEVYPKIKEGRKVLKEYHPIIVVSAYIRALDKEDRDILTILSANNLEWAELEKHIARWKEKDFNEEKLRYLYLHRSDNQANFSGDEVYGSFQLVMEDGDWVIQAYQFDEH